MADRYKKSYGAWAGNSAGNPPDFARCCEEIRDTSTRWPRYHQCNRKRGYGPDEAYCRQHDPAVAEARRKERDARENKRHHKQCLEWAGPRFFAVLKQIADGHNDPRTLAQEAIASHLPKEARDGTE